MPDTEISLTDFAQGVARHISTGQGPAAIFRDRSCSWPEIAAMARSLTTLFVELDVTRGQRVALIMRNLPEHVGAAMALFAGQMCAVIVNPFQSAERLARDLDRLGVVAILGSSDDLASDAVAELVRLQKLPAIAIDAMKVRLVSDASIRAVPVAPSRDSFDLSTSGTTGLPKRMAFEGSVVFAAASNMAAMFDEGEGNTTPHTDRVPVLVPYPLTNMSGLSFLLYAATHGRRLLLLERFDITQWVEAARNNPQQVIYLPPVAIRMLLDAGVERTIFASARVIRTGAAPLEDAVRDRFEAAYGVPVISHYGASEFCGTVASFPLADYAALRESKRGSIGRARPGNRLRVVDEAGNVIASGQAGLLEVQTDRLGPQWIRTTDLASIDADGYIRLHGRADDAINRGGFKIVPDVIASVLRNHPAVSDVAVVGLADARLGEVPVAAVETKGHVRVGEDELRDFARASLLAYQVPARIVIVTALPRTGNLKIDRAAVRALFDTSGQAQ